LTGTKSGRISSGGSRDGEDVVTVNLQNIHGDLQVQNMLVSDLHWQDIYKAWKEDGPHNEDWYKEFLERHIYLILDYSQNELRFLAQSSDDPLLIRQFNSGEDIHCLVGHELTGWPIERIRNDKQTRKLVKNFHFGMVYGLTVDGMLSYLIANGVPAKRRRVEEMMTTYFEKYKKVKEFIGDMRQMVRNHSYVKNILGFYCPLFATEEKGGAYWANQAVNLPIQGGAHQLLLIALALLKRKPVTYNLIRVPNMEIHDALVSGIRVKDLREGLRQSVQLLEKAVLAVLLDEFKLKWKVPLKADAKVGFRFGVGVDFTEGMKLRRMMNKWCMKNQESQQALYKELRKVERGNPVK
jgi:DNA polymerase I-like protein with 3'-5' exonuclease and polymerase domains